MHITLEQARTLDAISRLGSIAKAAAELHKVHTAVLYAIKQLEQETDLVILDRSGYRATLTPVGIRILEHCRRMLEAERELARFCETARLGHEPSLSIVYDGLLPVGPILAAVKAASKASPSTRISLFSEFLGDVEARADREHAELVISVVPLERPLMSSSAIAPLPSLLVTGVNHPLATIRRIGSEDLAFFPYLTVRGSDQRLKMSTSHLDKLSEFRLSDFHAKRAALLEGMGWGWMPEYLIEDDLTHGRLVVLPWGEKSRHVFEPLLHHRLPTPREGRATSAFVECLLEHSTPRPRERRSRRS